MYLLWRQLAVNDEVAVRIGVGEGKEEITHCAMEV
jgi:hypothetical protein